MKLTVFGATGKTGIHVVEQALEAGHDVVAYTRSPQKLTIQNPHLTVVQGDVRDAACIAQALDGADAVISALGPSQNKPDYQVTEGMRLIVDAMQQRGIRRIVLSAGAGVSDPDDSPKLIDRVVKLALLTFARHIYEDMRRAVEVVKASNLDWTVVRAPMLTDDAKKGTLKVGMVGKGTEVKLTRADFAAFLVSQVNDQTHLRRMPVISN